MGDSPYKEKVGGSILQRPPKKPQVRGRLRARRSKLHGRRSPLERLLDRYPWLADAEPARENDRPLGRTAPPPKKRRDGAAVQHSKASLEARFPPCGGMPGEARS